jgi:hypothetical protein
VEPSGPVGYINIPNGACRAGGDANHPAWLMLGETAEYLASQTDPWYLVLNQ